MKIKLLSVFLFITAFVNAQIVNIPDAALKARLLQAGSGSFSYVASGSNGSSIDIDANNDNEIQVSEALAVWKLNLYEANITSLAGLEAFTNLRVLWIRENYVTHINATVFPNLQELSCGDTGGLSFLNSINVSGMTTLKNLHCSNNNFTSLDLTGLTNLENLTCMNNNLTSLDISDSPMLKTLDISENNISTINVANYPQLSTLWVYDNPMTSLNLTGCTALKDLKCFSTGLTSLDLSPCLALETVYCGHNDNLTSINVGYLPNLTTISSEVTFITEIDLSGCPMLNYFACAGTDDLQFVNIKNGSKITQMDTFNNGHQKYLCVDDNELVIYQAIHANNPLVQVGSYCEFTPGGPYNTISGIFTFDSNGSGCDIAASVKPNVKVSIADLTQTASTFSNGTGQYSFFTLAGNFTITPQFEDNWFTVTPPTATINFSNTTNNTATQNFCLAPNGTHPDVEVLIVPVGNAQPGFDAYYRIIYKNKGNQALSGAVTFNYDDAVLDYVSATPDNTSASTGQLSWNYSNLLPFESRGIIVSLNLNGPMETPAINNGDILNYSVAITPTAGDETPVDNTFAFDQTVTGSFDPNDITCLEGETVHPDKIGEYLHYNINFENTGTAPATFIVVKDMINDQQFDVNTLQVMHASHNIETRITGNKVEFIFDDINLAPDGKGNVVFKIKTLPTVAVNSTVTQNADIYFDYNWPIVTNDANTIFAILNNGDFELDNTVKIYPNPTKDIVAISAVSEINSISLYDLQGRLLQSVPTNSTTASIDISARTNGIYFIQITTVNGVKTEKILKQ